VCFKQKTAYVVFTGLEFRRVLFRSDDQRGIVPHLHLQWALAAQVRDDPSLVIAAFAPDVRGARLAALTVDRTRIVDSDLEAIRRSGERRVGKARWDRGRGAGASDTA